MRNKQRGQESGSALVYILIAIALLAALTATFMNNSSQQTTSQNTFNTATELNSQINFIRSAIEECVLTYPGGDSVAIGASAQVNNPYPIQPDEPFFTAQAVTPGSSGDNLVKDIRCPGNPGDDADHELIFLGTSGKFLPPAPNYFNDWQYYNGAGGVFFWTETSFSDAFISTAMQKVADQYNECESDIIDATGGVVDIASEGAGVRDVNCANGATCLRIWMKRDGSSDLPDEAACN